MSTTGLAPAARSRTNPCSRAASAGVSTDVGSSRITSAGIEVEHLGEFDQLPFADREVAHAAVPGRVGASLREPAQRRRPSRGRLAPCHHGACGQATSRFSSTLQRRQQRELLEHHADAERHRVARRCKGDRRGRRCGCVRHPAGKAVEQLHQRALAGAVLAEQRQHLARGDLEVDARRWRRRSPKRFVGSPTIERSEAGAVRSCRQSSRRWRRPRPRRPAAGWRRRSRCARAAPRSPNSAMHQVRRAVDDLRHMREVGRAIDEAADAQAAVDAVERAAAGFAQRGEQVERADPRRRLAVFEVVLDADLADDSAPRRSTRRSGRRG